MLRKSSTVTRLIDLTVQILGSEAAVITLMQCERSEFDAWRAGMGAPPWPAFERMVTVLMESHRRVIAEQRELLRKISEDLEEEG
jgi:hypothetical protein